MLVFFLFFCLKPNLLMGASVFNNEISVQFSILKMPLSRGSLLKKAEDDTMTKERLHSVLARLFFFLRGMGWRKERTVK